MRARREYDSSRVPVFLIQVVNVVRISSLFHREKVRKEIERDYAQKWREVLVSLIDPEFIVCVKVRRIAHDDSRRAYLF